MFIDVKHRSEYILAALMLCSLIVRLSMFSGFVLGDDPAYAELVPPLLNNAYPALRVHDVIACRPIVLYAIAFCIHLFGWHEWSFVLPVLCASLLNTAIVYCAGVKLGGIRAGFFAAAAFIVFPLDAVHATTMCNDIMLSTFVWGGGLLLLLCKDISSNRAAQALAFISGLVAGAGVGVKFNAIVAPVLFVGLGFLYVLRSGRFYKVLVSWIAGWLVANAVLCLFFYKICGDFLAHYHTEMQLYLDNYSSGVFMPDTTSLQEALLSYPASIGIAGLWTGNYEIQELPYGFFYLAFLLCVPLCIFPRFKALRLPSLCALFYLLIMEFFPLKIYPHYVPINRLPRYLHIASIPAAVALGIVFSCLLRFRSGILKISTALVFLFFLATSWYWAWVPASMYKDCAMDCRQAWDAVQNIPAKEIITDSEMRNYFLFRSGFKPRWRMERFAKIPSRLPADAIVITGGARRPEMFTKYAHSWLDGKKIDPELQVFESPCDLRLWRFSKLAIYKTDRQIELGDFDPPAEDEHQ